MRQPAAGHSPALRKREVHGGKRESHGCARLGDCVSVKAVQQPVPTPAAKCATDPPEAIRTESDLEEVLTRPSTRLIEFIKTVSSPLLVLGAGGKMGPTLAMLARRAADAAGHPLEVVAVSRFGNAASRQWLETRGVGTVSCDLLDADAVARLPDAEKLLLDEMPVIPLYFNARNFLLRPAVHGWQEDALWTRYYENVSLHEKRHSEP